MTQERSFYLNFSQFGDVEKVVNLQSGVFTLDTLYLENFLGEVFELKNNNLDFFIYCDQHITSF